MDVEGSALTVRTDDGVCRIGGTGKSVAGEAAAQCDGLINDGEGVSLFDVCIGAFLEEEGVAIFGEIKGEG